MHLLHDKELMHSYMRLKIVKTEMCGDIRSLAICFYHAYIMQMEGIAKWLLPLFDSELFG